MRLIQVGKYIFNLALVTHIERYESGSISVYLSGVPKGVRLDGKDAEAFLMEVSPS